LPIALRGVFGLVFHDTAFFDVSMPKVKQNLLVAKTEMHDGSQRGYDNPTA